MAFAGIDSCSAFLCVECPLEKAVAAAALLKEHRKTRQQRFDKIVDARLLENKTDNQIYFAFVCLCFSGIGHRQSANRHQTREGETQRY